MASDRRGSSTLVTRGIIAVVFAVVLVFLVVLVINRDALKRRRGAGAGTQDNASGMVTITGEGRETEFGVQIGNDLKAFIADDSFFDDVVSAPETPYTEDAAVPLRLALSVEDGAIAVRVTDEAGTVMTGEMFTIVIVRRSENPGSDLVFVDDDKDGVIRVEGLSNGRFGVTLREQEGYRVPADAYEIMVGNEEDRGEDNPDENG